MLRAERHGSIPVFLKKQQSEDFSFEYEEYQRNYTFVTTKAKTNCHTQPEDKGR